MFLAPLMLGTVLGAGEELRGELIPVSGALTVSWGSQTHAQGSLGVLAQADIHCGIESAGGCLREQEMREVMLEFSLER